MAPQAHEVSSPPPPRIGASTRDVNGASTSSANESSSCCRTFTNKINKTLEGCFGRIGFGVANNPWKTILITLMLSGVCFIGITEQKDENRGEKLWVSQSSDPIKHKDWIDEAFPIDFREVGLLLEMENGGNVLTPKALKKLYQLYVMTKNIYNGTESKQWKDICYSSSDDASDCIPLSVLDLWSYDIDIISNLTQNDIIETINEKNLESPLTGRPLAITLMVGGSISRDQSGRIISASVLKIDFRLKKRAVFDEGKGLEVDEDADDWEEEFDNVFKQDFPGYKIYSFSLWANNKASSDATNGDLQFFVVGYILVIIYLSTMLGSFSRFNHKIYLAIAGIGVIGISIGISFGLGSAFQFKYTGVHGVLPFLLLGIGVDDIFVIVQSWDNVGGPKLDGRGVPEKISLALRHAGVSVLVTSVTDICAFAIGSATILPGLQSFSVWCAIGILAIFLLTITLFVALLTLDARRQQANRDACLCCMKLSESYEPMKCADKKILKGFMKNYYSRVLLSTPGKIITLLVVAGLFGTGIYGLTELEQDFDFIWFLPKTSRPRLYTERDRDAFPGNGFPGNVYIGEIDYYNGFDAMNKVKNTLEQDKYIANNSVNSWFHDYHAWLHLTYPEQLVQDQGCNQTKSCRAPNAIQFNTWLEEFLNSTYGRTYNASVKRENGNIKASKISYRHIKLFGSSEEIDAMDSIREEIKPGLIDGENHPLLPFAYSPRYINWETNKVIGIELIRNLALAGLCVLVVTLFLISNVVTSLMVLACVVLSLIDIAAFMGFWGLTIDTVTTIILVIAIGLTVDYSVHIGHGFMTAKAKDKNERVTATLAEVGPAVVHGGTSTFLAFALLAASESYAFYTFFRVFFLVVIFGLFHGLVFLPVILSLIGPAPYADHTSGENTTATQKARNEPVQLERVSKKNEESFVVVVDSAGQQNIAYVPE